MIRIAGVEFKHITRAYLNRMGKNRLNNRPLIVLNLHCKCLFIKRTIWITDFNRKRNRINIFMSYSHCVPL